MILFVAADQGSLEGNRSGCLLAVFFGRMNRTNHLVEGEGRGAASVVKL